MKAFTDVRYPHIPRVIHISSTQITRIELPSVTIRSMRKDKELATTMRRNGKVIWKFIAP